MLPNTQSIPSRTTVGPGIFISYAREDRIFVRELARELGNRNCKVALDENDILPAEPWQVRLSHLILGSDVILCVITTHSIESQNCGWECAEAMRLAKRLVPVVRERIDPSQIPTLAHLNFLFMTQEDDLAAAYDRLMATITVDFEWVREHTRLALLAERWRQRGRPPSEILRGDSLAAAEQWLRLKPAGEIQPTEAQTEFIGESRMRFDQEEREKKNVLDTYMISQSRFLVEHANQQTSMGDPVTGALLALEALPQETDLIARPYVAAAEYALIDAYFRIRECKLLSFEVDVKSLAMHPSGDAIAVGLKDGGVEVCSLSQDPRTGVKEHTGKVNSVAFSSTGDRLLSSSEDGSCILRDYPSLRSIAVFRNEGEGCDDGRITPDGATVLTKAGFTISSWDTATSQQRAAWQLSNNRLVHGFDLSKDGQFVAIGSGRFAFDLLDRDDEGEKVVRVWEVCSGTQLAELTEFSRGVLAVIFDHLDGRRLLVVSADGAARIWPWSGGEASILLSGHTDRAVAGDWRVDGKQVITASHDKTSRIWTETGALVATLKGHGQAVLKARFTPDGRRAITASVDATARIWNASTGTSLLTLRGHERSVFDALPVNGGKQIVTISYDNTARVWNAGKIVQARQLRFCRSEKYSGIAMSSGSRRLLICTDQGACVWDSTNGEVTWQIENRASRPYEGETALFSPDDQRFLLRYDDAIHMYDAITHDSISVLEHSGESLERVAFSPDGRHCLTGTDVLPLRLWSAEDGRLLGELEADSGQKERISSACFNADGSHVMAANENGKVRIWSTATRELRNTIEHKSRKIEAMALHPTFPLCAAMGRAGISVWNFQGEQVKKFATPELPKYGHRIEELRFSPKGTMLLAKTQDDDDDKLWFWDFESGKFLGDIGGAALDNEIAVFSPDETRFISVFYAQTGLYGSISSARARLWALPEMKTVAILAKPGEDTTAAAFDLLGRFAATGHENGSVRLWDAPTGELITTLKGHTSTVDKIVFSSDCSILVTCSDDGVIVRQMFASTQAAIAEIRNIVPRALTSEQRNRFFLSPEPPAWCIEAGKWPFHTTR